MASVPRVWKGEADILIVGSGAAALSTATAAVQSGNRVMVFEKGEFTGGTTRWSDGAYYIANNHFLRAKDIPDPRHDSISYLLSTAYPGRYRENEPRFGLPEREYKLIETFYDHGAEILEGLDASGILKSMHGFRPDIFDHAPQNKVLRGRALVVQRSPGKRGFGTDIVEQFIAFLERHNTPILLKHRVSGLERNRNGIIIGVKVETPDGTAFYRGRKAVVFGTGGYTHDTDLIANFQPGSIFGGTAVPTNQGDFVRIGIDAGAMLGNMSNAWRSQIVLEEALASPGNPQFRTQPSGVPCHLWQPPGDSMILVNKTGRRVANEKRAHNELARIHLVWDPAENEYPNQFLFMVYDSRSAELFAGNFPLPHPNEQASYVIEADGIPNLAKAIQQRLDSLMPQIPRTNLADNFAEALAKQIERFNEDASRNEDREFGRGKYPYDTEWHRDVYSIARTDTAWPANTGPNVSLHPLKNTGPYYAIILAAGIVDTNGGPITNEKAQVLDTKGLPIPGLYGAGNCIASPAAQAYWGAGGTLGPAITFGTIAGREAALEILKEDV
jgi:3-oxosteroid 1-dehydrogenase